MTYVLHQLIMISIYLILVYATNLVTGLGGLMTMAQAAFYGMGAYVYALVALNMPVGFAASCGISLLVAGLVAWILSKVVLRFRGETFVLATLAFQMIVFTILDNWESVTGGSYGLSEIPRPALFGYEITGIWGYLGLAVCMAAFITGIVWVMYQSPFGLSVRAVRDNERAAESLRISPQKQLSRAFVISAVLASFAGCLFASYVTYIDPTSFSLTESIFILCILLVGGSGNLIGPFLGVLFMILFPEGLRFLGLPDESAANIREIVYGTILIILMYYRPSGLKGIYSVK